MARRKSVKLASFDAFLKFEKNYADTTASGGFLTMIVVALLSLLIWSETRDWLKVQEDFQFVVDKVRRLNGGLTRLGHCTKIKCQH
jgi:hypothetical protein